MAHRITGEEIANAITHGIGVLCTIGLGIPLIAMAYRTSWQYAFGMTFFIVCMALVYSLSTAYHLTFPGKGKRVMRVFDHISIYFMIAGSYAPICIGLVGGWPGWVLFGIQWFLVLVGIIYKSVALEKWPRLSLFIYLAMGWSILFIASPVLRNINTPALVWLLVEGAMYTIGAYFFAHDEEHAYWHAIWHVWVLAGTLAHCASLYYLMA